MAGVLPRDPKSGTVKQHAPRAGVSSPAVKIAASWASRQPLPNQNQNLWQGDYLNQLSGVILTLALAVRVIKIYRLLILLR